MDGKVGQSADWTTRRSMKIIVKAHSGLNGVNLTFSHTEIVTAHAVLPYADVLAHGYCSFWFQNRLGTITAVVSAILTSGGWFSRAGGLVGEFSDAPANEPHPQRVRSCPSSASFLKHDHLPLAHPASLRWCAGPRGTGLSGEAA
jgi:hypothetical protein